MLKLAKTPDRPAARRPSMVFLASNSSPRFRMSPRKGWAVWSKYEESYREEVLEGALANWEIPLLPPPLLEGYRSDDLQQALEICSQTSCT